MRRLKVDVLVVGAGPAGASAAAVAARLQCRVLLIDKRSRIGEPVQCAEFVPLALAPRVRDGAIVQQRISHMRNVLPSGDDITTDFPGFIIDRGALDKRLAGLAVEYGAELNAAARLEGLDPASRTASIQRADGEVMSVRYGVLVAADGPRSTVGRRLGLPALATVSTRQYRVALPRALREATIWLSARFPGGYAWLFPRGRSANLGIAADKSVGTGLKRPLDALHRLLSRQGVVCETVLGRTGGEAPVGGLRPQLVVGSAVFCGDAAGLTHPISGAGIAAAVASGEEAGAQVTAFLGGDRRALQDYEEEIRAVYGAALERACKRRAQVLHAQRAGRYDDAAARSGWVGFSEYYQEAASREPCGA